MKDWELCRRDLLKTLGVGAGCLPFIHSSRAWSAGTGAPTKLFIVASTEGYRQANWRPKDGSLLTQTLPDSSSPMEPHKADLIFMPGLTHPTFTGPRHGGFCSQLTAGPVSGVGEYQQAYSPSIDQVIGPALAKTSNVSRAQLNLGVMTNGGVTPEGNNSKWCIFKGKDQSVIPEQDPWKTYGDIFAGVTTSAAPASTQVAATKMLAQRKSILDFVGTDLEKFATRLGTDDKVIVGGHLQAVRDLEKELLATSSTTGANQAQCGSGLTPATAISATDTSKYADVLKVQMDLGVMALKCGVTRVVTLQMIDASGGSIPFNFLPGVSGTGAGSIGTSLRSWHDLAHNPVTNSVDMKSIVDKWCMGQFAALLDRMKAIAEPGGTMLDNSVVLITNHMEDGSNHDTQKLPWILAGNCQGYFKTGQCALSAGNPIGGALADVYNAVIPDAPVTYFGDATHGKPWVGLRA
jgi:hypothetical protein